MAIRDVFSLESFWTLRSFQNCATFLAEKKKKKKGKSVFWLSSLERLGLIWRKIRPALRARAIVWSQVHLAGRQEKKMCAFKFLTWKFLKMNNWVKNVANYCSCFFLTILLILWMHVIVKVSQFHVEFISPNLMKGLKVALMWKSWWC